MINPIRFGGIASGLDTETMVKQLMRAERMPMERMLQRKQWTEWQRDAYREVNSQLLEFRNLTFNMRLQSTFMSKKVASSNEGIATATATSSAENFNYELQVNQLAKGGYRNSGDFISITDPTDKTALAPFVGDQFSINGTSFTIQGDESLNDLLRRINDSRIGVSAFYDNGKVSISSMVTGENKLIIDDTDGFLTNELKLTEGFNGQDAKFILNGLATTRDSNSFTINGVAFSLKAEGTTRISSSADVDKIFNTIKSFIDKYNELIEQSNFKISEKRYRDFPPLTEEQKKDMGEKEIELWESKAKSGLLRGDTMISSILTDLRVQMGDPVANLGNGAISALFQIGIKSNNYLDRGALSIDEAELRKAIEEKPQEVMDLFTKQSENASEQGIASRLHSSVVSGVSRLTEKAGRANITIDTSFMSKELQRFDDQLSRFERRLFNVENRYWAKFTAMEKAMSNIQSQGEWLMSQLYSQ